MLHPAQPFWGGLCSFVMFEKCGDSVSTRRTTTLHKKKNDPNLELDWQTVLGRCAQPCLRQHQLLHSRVRCFFVLFALLFRVASIALAPCGIILFGVLKILKRDLIKAMRPRMWNRKRCTSGGKREERAWIVLHNSRIRRHLFE